MTLGAVPGLFKKRAQNCVSWPAEGTEQHKALPAPGPSSSHPQNLTVAFLGASPDGVAFSCF